MKYVHQPHEVPSYPCPVCGARGWINVNDVNKRVKEPEHQCDQLDVVNRLKADRDCNRCATNSCMLEREIKELKSVIESRDLRIADLEAQYNRDRLDLELLDTLLKTLNPLIRVHHKMPYIVLGKKMDCLCQDVIEFRRKHNIVG